MGSGYHSRIVTVDDEIPVFVRICFRNKLIKASPIGEAFMSYINLRTPNINHLKN
jgi:hypothetical protein